MITGANRGLGQATANFFANKGWQVFATMRDIKKAPQWEEGLAIEDYELDVEHELSARNAIEKILSRHKNIDVVVNNAGVAVDGAFEGMTTNDIKKQFAVNVFGTMNVIREVLPIFRKDKKGTVINISSTSGEVAFPYTTAYTASKFAIEGFSESLRYELQEHGIQVKLVVPDSFQSGLVSNMIWSEHVAYEKQLSKAKKAINKAYENVPTADTVAKIIFKAATDNSDCFRFHAGGRGVLLVNKMLPDIAWRRLVSSW